MHAVRQTREAISSSTASGQALSDPEISMRSADRDIDITVIFSHGVSLKTWYDAGILEREVSYYRELAAGAGSMTFLTYDRSGTGFRELRAQVSPINVMNNDTRLPYQLFGLVAPFRYIRAIGRSDVIRTNQFSGAWVGVIAKWLSRKPLVVRGGFARSQFLDRQKSTGRVRRGLIRYLEGFSLRRADMVFVTTPAIRDSIVKRHHLNADRVEIVPNPIDIHGFKPGPADAEEAGLVLAVGRLAPEKNLEALLDAMGSIDNSRLELAGSGPDEEALRSRAGANVQFLGRVPNSDIPGLLGKAQVYVLPSRQEGSPKALLEAMASGKAVVGADSPGIREVIEDGVNGLLVAGTRDALADAINRLLGDAALRARLGAAAREYVEKTNSQAASVALESDLLRRLVGS